VIDGKEFLEKYGWISDALRDFKRDLLSQYELAQLIKTRLDAKDAAYSALKSSRENAAIAYQLLEAELAAMKASGEDICNKAHQDLIHKHEALKAELKAVRWQLQRARNFLSQTTCTLSMLEDIDAVLAPAPSGGAQHKMFCNYQHQPLGSYGCICLRPEVPGD
jgi:chromosome segregation ATPase